MGQTHYSWQKDFEIPADAAMRLISEQFPALQPVRVAPLSSGWDNQVFAVNDAYIFRFPRSHSASALMQRELRVLPQLNSRITLPIPKILFPGQPTPDYPSPFMGYEELAGSVPHLVALTENVRNRCAKNLGSFLRTLHDVDVAEAQQWGVPGETLGRLDSATVVPRFDRYLNIAVASGLIDNPDPLRQLVAKIAGRPPLTEQRLIHGDLNFRNIVLHPEGGLAGVIDWGNIHIGHPAVDLSLIFSFLSPQGRELFSQTYGPISEETQLWAQFRAAYSNLKILVHAWEIHDCEPRHEADAALALSLKTLTPQSF
jgi:aminoglycoside phosphotransferase (APT) family kinase protein